MDTSSRDSIMKRDVVGRVSYTGEQREALLDEFERSGLKGAEFARRAGVKYQTFAHWVQQRRHPRRRLDQWRPPRFPLGIPRNRTTSRVSSIADANVLRSTGYTPNELNQYATITHPQPGWLVLRGSLNETAGNSVTIDGAAPTLTSGALWFHEQSVDNSGGPVRRVASITASRADGGRSGGPVHTTQKGAVFIPPPSESPIYDLDGNLTSDARWTYTWDAENRLIAVEEKSGIPIVPTGSTTATRTRLEFGYDARGRRLTKRVYVGTSGNFALKQSLLFLYDGWNIIAEIDTTTSATLLRSYEWGMDISGTMTGAGGVGGLLAVRFHAPATMANSLLPPGVHVPLYDGNGNVTELVNLVNGQVSASYEYGAFGETISMDSGVVTASNPFRFSSKYLDVETGFYNYGLRLYRPLDACWTSRDPIEERGGTNLYGMLKNDTINRCDYLGLSAMQFQPCTVKLGIAHDDTAAEALGDWIEGWQRYTGLNGSWNSSMDPREPYARASTLGCNYYGGNGSSGIQGYKGSTETNSKDAERILYNNLSGSSQERNLGIIREHANFRGVDPAWNGGFNPEPTVFADATGNLIWNWSEENQAAGFLKIISYNWQQALKTADDLASQCKKSKNCCCKDIKVSFHFLDSDSKSIYDRGKNRVWQKWGSYVTDNDISSKFKNLAPGNRVTEMPAAGIIRFKIHQ